MEVPLPSDHLPGGRHCPFSSSPLPRVGRRQAASLDPPPLHQLTARTLSCGRPGTGGRGGGGRRGRQGHRTGRQFKISNPGLKENMLAAK